MLFADKFRQLREEKQLLQRQLASALEVDTQCIAKLNVETVLLSVSKWLLLQRFFQLMKMNY